jgi:TetR/AcrR family transcriptional repressor of nem operon
MVQKTIGRGRPLEFDPDSVLRKVMELFWERGFESTSIQDLEQCTRLSRTSLYNTYGSKRKIFSLAILKYQQLLAEEMLLPLEKGSAGLEDVHAFLGLVEQQLLSKKTPSGCLMVNSMTEFGGTDADFVFQAETYISRFLSGITVALKRAAVRGEISKGYIDSYAGVILAFVLGVNVLSRSAVKGTDVALLIKSAHELTHGWQQRKSRIRPRGYP